MRPPDTFTNIDPPPTPVKIVAETETATKRETRISGIGTNFRLGNYQNFHQGRCFGVPDGIRTSGARVGSLTVGDAVGFGGRLMRTSLFGRHFWSGSSSPAKPAALVGPRGGRGGGLAGCGFGGG
jgi:hypothetical protein